MTTVSGISAAAKRNEVLAGPSKDRQRQQPVRSIDTFTSTAIRNAVYKMYQPTIVNYQYKMKNIYSIVPQLFFIILAHACLPKEQYGNDAERKAYVGKHNYLRLQLSEGQVPKQPKATNVFNLKYDNNLEQEAYKISKTCAFKHVTVKDARWWHVGQNLFKSTNEVGWDHAIQAWFNEYSVYSYPDSASTKTGHYTQVIWSSTDKIGCAHTKCNNFHLYVCNYGPGGNIIGVKPYKTR
ncbi:hypothetical protein RN001_002780 [Aquatica leii]|uniref:SCP domain-containing protein n=1 Tax=Aquatica leii TaxID=1421715 RepID=A0AAN7PHC5_9COLE|nr:hypothetical protein RN001_002780 [Aquatica leii]